MLPWVSQVQPSLFDLAVDNIDMLSIYSRVKKTRPNLWVLWAINNVIQKLSSSILKKYQYPFERPLKAFCSINLGEAQDQRLQLFEPEASFVIA